MEAGSAAWPELQPGGLTAAAVGVCGALGPAGWQSCDSPAEPPATAALGRFGGSPDLSEKGCNAKAE